MDIKKGHNTATAVFLWVCTAGYMALIYYLSSHSGLSLPNITDHFDKIVHVCAYVPLAFLLYLSLEKSGVSRYVFAAAFVCATMYGIADEFHQSLVPGRDAAVGDVLADSIGALLGSAAAKLIKRDGSVTAMFQE